MIQNKQLVRLVASIVCGSIILGTPLFIYAEDEDLTNQLNTVQQQMNEQSSKATDAEAVIVSVFEQLRQIDAELQQATNELQAIQQQRIALDNDIAQNEKLLAEALKRLEEREKVFYKRVRDIYINGRLSYIDVVVGAKDFNDFANRMEILKRIVDADVNLIKEIMHEREEIEARKAKLEEDRAKVVELEKAAQAKQVEIEQKRAERAIVLEKAQSDKATAMAAIQELQAASAQISDMLKQRQAERAAAAAAEAAAAAAAGQAPPPTSYTQGTGVLGWPANGEITSPYGYRTHPIFGTTIYHSGIDIGVDYGTPVHSADSGTVVYAGWMSGYGNTVVVDHGNGISTLYGHNEDVAVSEGQSVGKGSVIAYAGSTGNSTGPHVHFEVRVNGDPTDPMGYL